MNPHYYVIYCHNWIIKRQHRCYWLILEVHFKSSLFGEELIGGLTSVAHCSLDCGPQRENITSHSGKQSLQICLVWALRHLHERRYVFLTLSTTW